MPEDDLSPELRRHTYLIAKELISNAHRHAHATSASITLLVRDGALEIGARDDGVGFDPALVSSDSFGLAGTARRVESLGGVLRIVRSSGSGTEVLVRIRI